MGTLGPAVGSGSRGLSLPTVSHAMARLQKSAIVKEISGKRRKQVFAYQAYWKLITRGMEETCD